MWQKRKRAAEAAHSPHPSQRTRRPAGVTLHDSRLPSWRCLPSSPASWPWRELVGIAAALAARWRRRLSASSAWLAGIDKHPFDRFHPVPLGFVGRWGCALGPLQQLAAVADRPAEMAGEPVAGVNVEAVGVGD